MASTYPGAIDTFPTSRDSADLVGPDVLDHADAANKIEAELGTNPSGSAATVGERLDDAAADLAVKSRNLSDLARTGGWLPTGAIDQTILDRMGPTATIVLVSGTLRLSSGVVIPGGRAVSSITYVSGSTAAGTPTAQWFCLVDKATLAVLATTVDDGATAWGASTSKTLLLATVVGGGTPGGTYTPAVATEVYLGVCVVAGTPPSILGLTVSSVLSAIAPAMAGISTTGLTTPSSLTSPVTAITAQNFINYGYIS